MKKFECTVTREDKYIIELDENVLNEEWMKDFRKVFFDFDGLDEHAEQIAQMRARFNRSFIEGYGVPLIDGEKPPFIKDEQVNKAINIVVISEDENCDVEVEEI
jgi:hypothetical protein